MVLTITTAQQPGGVVAVTLAGSLDSVTYEQLERTLQPLLRTTTKVLVLDLAGLTFISSMGLGIIFKARTTIEQGGGTFLLTNLQPQIKKVFDIAKAIPSMSIFASRQEADEYLAKIQRDEVDRARSADDEI